MQKFLLFFCAIFIGVHCACADDTTPQAVDAETNISIVENSIKLNEEKFNQIAEQIAKRYPNFDWVEFDKLEPGAKRIVLKNYLARLAFEEIKQNYIQDIYAKAKDGVQVERDDDGNTYYFNKSDAKYRTNYVTEQDLVKKANVSNKCDGCSWVYFKQTDVPKLDALIKQATANTPAEMHCEKYCAILDQNNESKRQEFLIKFKNILDEYKKDSQEYLASLNRKNGFSKKDIREERKKQAQNIRKLEQEYDDWKKLFFDDREWQILPYTPDCEMVTVGCWNVEQRPENYTKIELHIEDHSDDIIQLHYEYDDIPNNKHIDSSAWKNCTCNQDINDVSAHVVCSCDISFFDGIQDFAKVRKWENQNKIDIKNGKMQDLNADGTHNRHWESQTIPGEQVYGRGFDLWGQDSISRDEN